MQQTTFPEHDFRVEKVAAPLRHGVTESIRYAIALGRFKSGERLPERALCEMTGVSRTLVREALRQLESEGLIKVLPHRGPMVVEAQRRAGRRHLSGPHRAGRPRLPAFRRACVR